MNNALVTHLNEGGTLERFDMSPYPLVAAFSEAASASKQGDARGSVPPGSPAGKCGNWNNPIPNHTPERKYGYGRGPGAYLLANGFHKTILYACGGDPLSGGSCESDYTRPRSYGRCEYPRFRDQARVTESRKYWIQYGEPNPEVKSYSWPYPGWPAYVKWWHDKY